MTKTITYNGTILEYKATHRALKDYALAKGSDNVDNYADTLLLMFCIVRSQAKIAKIEFTLDMEGFVDWLDENPNALKGFTAEEEVDKVKGDGSLDSARDKKKD